MALSGLWQKHTLFPPYFAPSAPLRSSETFGAGGCSETEFQETFGLKQEGTAEEVVLYAWKLSVGSKPVLVV